MSLSVIFWNPFPFCSLVFPYLENRNRLEFAVCGIWEGFSRAERLLTHIQEGLALLYQVEIS